MYNAIAKVSDGLHVLFSVDIMTLEITQAPSLHSHHVDLNDLQVRTVNICFGCANQMTLPVPLITQ